MSETYYHHIQEIIGPVPDIYIVTFSYDLVANRNVCLSTVYYLFMSALHFWHELLIMAPHEIH